MQGADTSVPPRRTDHTMHRRSRHDRGFTLVELLVVIGIVVVLIGVLLPVLSGIAARGRDLRCQSNIRQCVTLILTYSSENKGQLPFGMYWSPRREDHSPTHWWPGADAQLISVWSIISRMSSKSYSGERLEFHVNPGPRATAYAPFLRCPEAMQVQSHLCSYVASMAAFVSPLEDERAGATRAGVPWERLVERPTKTTQCASFTALIWDTAVHPRMETDIGYVVGGDIDGQRIWTGATRPQMRYCSPHDPFARLLPGGFGNNRPVLVNVGNFSYRNIDPPDAVIWPYQGNLRFRHRKNTTCNVGYADGHVGQFTGKFKSDGTPIAHDAIRKSFMVKWPSGTGIAPDPALPH